MRYPVKVTAVFLILFSMLVGLSGCQESSAFTQTVYNQQSEDVTDDDELIENEPDNEEEDEDIFSTDDRENADRENHFEYTETNYDSRDEDHGPAANASYLDYAAGHGNSTQSDGGEDQPRQSDDGVSPDTPDQEQPEEETQDEERNLPDEEQNDDEDEADEDERSGVNPDEDEDDDEPGSSDDENVINDDQGSSNDEPDPDSDLLTVDTSIEHLHTSDYVFATGSAALLVQMLGGEGKLAGCDAATLADMRGYFPASELAGVSAVWKSSGKSDLAAQTVNEMETLPEYCLYDVNDISTAAVRTLTELGVTCVELDFRYATGILNAVETVRETLGTEYADEMAQKYTAFYNGIVNTLSNSIGTYTSGGVNYDCKTYGRLTTVSSTCTNGVSTLFISAWDEDASMTIYRDDMDWSVTFPGLAVANVSYTNSPISYFMSIAGVENKGASTATNTGGKATYIYTFGFASAKLKPTYGTLASTCETGLTATLASGLGGITGATSGFNGVGSTGGSAFPALVVASSAVEAGIRGSDMWKVYDYDTAGGNTRGFYDGKGTLVQSIISDEYDVYVNPNGLGNWMTGSAESILEAPWIAWKFHDGEAYSESDVRALISEFYSTFYRCNLSASQIGAILDGD